MKKKEIVQRSEPFTSVFRQRLNEKGYKFSKDEVKDIYTIFIDVIINDYLLKLKVLRLPEFINITPSITNFKGLAMRNKSTTDGKYINLHFKKSKGLADSLRDKLVEMIKYQKENEN